jgi:hypothetical protein
MVVSLAEFAMPIASFIKKHVLRLLKRLTFDNWPRNNQAKGRSR